MKDWHGKATNLLLAAAAFHDSGRDGQDGNRNHAEASAIEAKKYFESNKNNSFGVNQEDIPIIQTAIHYHEHNEKEIGKLDEEKIKELCNVYGVKPSEFESTKKICELLKDADALDRTRFSRTGRLNPKYLRSKSASKILKYAYSINKCLARNILTTIYEVPREEKELYKDPIEFLRKKRTDMNIGYKEPHLSFETRMKEVFMFNELYLGNNTPQKDIASKNNKNEALIRTYEKMQITTADVKDIYNELKQEKLNKPTQEQKKDLEGYDYDG